MGNIAYFATIVVMFLVAVVLVRTALVATPPPLVTSPPPISVNSMDVAKHLAAAIRFKTISYGDGVHEDQKNTQLDALRAWMEQTYPAFHHAATREIIGKSLLFRDPAGLRLIQVAVDLLAA